MDKVPLLLTPGPLTTSATVKEAMLRDWGSRDPGFVAMNAGLRQRLGAIANAQDCHEVVLLQGSGTFAVEAMIGTLLPRSAAKLLVLVNGAYGHRMVKIARTLGRAVDFMEWAEDVQVSPAEVDARLRQDQAITHVAVVHCETTSGILNHVSKIAEVVRRHRRELFIDAMSAFGTLALDAGEIPFLAAAASSNKCLEGVPGLGFVIARKDGLAASVGNAHSLALDLYDQWQGFKANGQWRFTPPTHVVAALSQALDEFDAEGGVAGRGGRYRDNLKVLVGGMRAMGFETLLSDDVQAPIIVTFRMPADPAFDFQTFYEAMGRQGFLIYPGKLTVADSFRMGCIGRLTTSDMANAVAAVRFVLGELGVASGAPE
ncbi:2-aminoethylphosphonate--pyruvate transaminase 2 [Rhodospirillaceae bacterium LM-1]|nr:2-aminoethylphosphonate--pyruvate transaminase 2 [Rhodospirillaceae bacterium LM-1]